MAYNEKNGAKVSVTPAGAYSSEMELTEPTKLLTEVDIPEPEDYYNLGHHIKSHYGEVFIEPRHYEVTTTGRYLAPWIKKIACLLFENVQAAVYYSLSLVIGILLAFVYGLLFAINSFFIVWVVQPSIKLAFTWMRVMALLLRASVRISLDPVFQSCGNIFSLIAGRFTFTLKGLPERVVTQI